MIKGMVESNIQIHHNNSVFIENKKKMNEKNYSIQFNRVLISRAMDIVNFLERFEDIEINGFHIYNKEKIINKFVPKHYINFELLRKFVKKQYKNDYYEFCDILLEMDTKKI